MPDSFSIGLCDKRLTGSAEFGILEKIMGFFLKGKSKDLEKGKRMSENEMLNKKETLEEALGEEIEAVKGTVEEAAENAADKTLEDLEAENEKLRQELELMKEKTVKERIYDHVHVSVRTMDIFIGVMVVLFVVVVVLGILNK